METKHVDITDSDAFRIAWGQHCKRRLIANAMNRQENVTGPEPGPITEYEYAAFESAFTAGFNYVNEFRQ